MSAPRSVSVGGFPVWFFGVMVCSHLALVGFYLDRIADALEAGVKLADQCGCGGLPDGVESEIVRGEQ